jgi:hypothetical protein
MKTAFKEWAIVCQALARGEQILILRKGGIIEDGGEFRPDRPEFLLLPTWLHQSPDGLMPAVRARLPGVEAEQPPAAMIAISHWAEVAEARRISSLAAVERLRPAHVWSDAIIAERFHRWRDSIFALVVRVYALPTPVVMPADDEYAGCKSWVELADDVPTAGSQPVVSDADFERRATEIRSLLLAGEGVGPTAS